MRVWCWVLLLGLIAVALPVRADDASLATLKQKLTSKAREAQQLEAQALELEEKLADLHQQADAIRATTAAQRTETQAMLNAIIRLRQAPPHTILLDDAAPADKARAGMVVAGLLENLRQQQLALRQQAISLHETEKQLAAERARLVENQQALGKERQALAALIAERERQQPPPTPPAEALAKAVDSIVAGNGTVDAVITQTEQQQRAVPLPPARDEASFKDYVAITSPHAETLTRGNVLLPVAGRLITRYGERNSMGHTVRGITLRATPGATVVAPFSGTVIFAGDFRGYGMTLIIRHKGGYHSVLAGMADTDTAVGEWLVSGEPVGYLPDQAPVELYYELRQSGTAVNPLPWLANAPKNNAS